MRKLLNTLYVFTEDAYLSLENENVVVLGPRTERSLDVFPCILLSRYLAFLAKVQALN